jgi:hypothetical protein
MVYAEDEHIAPFFLKKNGFRGVHPVGRIRRNALNHGPRTSNPAQSCIPMAPIGDNAVRSCGSKLLPCIKRRAQKAAAIIRGVVAHSPVRAQEINAGPPEDATLEELGDHAL